MKQLIITILFFIAPVFVSAQSADDYSVRESCFQTLKENMKEAGVSSKAIYLVDDISYEELEKDFSRNYKSLSSFGIEVDQQLFEMRVSSFGDQTGYKHPPNLPFPAQIESEVWDDAMKEYLIGEEFVKAPDGQLRFIGCGLISLSSTDLLAVTRDTYLYDGPIISVAKTSSDNSYKALFSTNIFFNYNNEQIGQWARMFIYPKKTENDYFSKYAVQDAYPAHTTNSFEVLRFGEKVVGITHEEEPETKTLVTKYYVQDEATGEIVKRELPKEFLPIEPTGQNVDFYFMSYYQAIENLYPEFGKRLSLRGTLSFKTYKEIINDENLSPEVSSLLATLRDVRAISAYARDKAEATRLGTTLTNPLYETTYGQINDANEVVVELNANKDVQPESVQKDYTYSFTRLLIIAVSVALVLCGLTYFAVERRKRNSQLTSVEVGDLSNSDPNKK